MACYHSARGGLTGHPDWPRVCQEKTQLLRIVLPQREKCNNRVAPLLTARRSLGRYHSYGAVAVTGTPPFNLTAPVIDEVFTQAAVDLGGKVARALLHAKRRVEL